MRDAADSAVLVLGAALRRTVAELDGFEAGILAGADDALHQARTRVRALRSTLSVYRGAFDADASRALRDSLASYGGLLGEARDAEVRLLALRELRDAVADQKTRAALAELVASAEATAARGLERVVTGIDSLEHARLLHRLRRFAASPPAGSDGDAAAVPFARAALAEAVARMSHEAKHARPDRLDDLHTLRKAARRVRYAAEAVAGSWPTAEAPTVREETAPGAAIPPCRGGDGDVGGGGGGVEIDGSAVDVAEVAVRSGGAVGGDTEVSEGTVRDTEGAGSSWAEASALAEAAEQLQDALGDHRDGVLLAGELRDWASRRDARQRESLRALADEIERAADAGLAELPQLLSGVRAAAAGLGRPRTL